MFRESMGLKKQEISELADISANDVALRNFYGRNNWDKMKEKGQ